MTEIQLQWLAFLKIIWVSVFAFLYSWGGYFKKWLRRILGAIFMVAGITLVSKLQGTFSWFYLAYLPCLYAALSVGYGGDTFPEKFGRRFNYGMALGASAVVFPLVNGCWGLFLAHVGLCVIGSVVLGVFNIARNARDEETLFGVMAGLLPMFMA